MKFRLVGLRAPILAAVFVFALAPSTALADANPNNHGHHYHFGWVNHHSPPPPAPTPAPGGGGTAGGPSNNVSHIAPAALVGQAPEAPQAPAVVPPETPVLQPPSGVVTTVQPLLAGQNVWLVAILLASFLAANVAAVVLLTGRAGHYAIQRTLTPAGIKL